MRALTHAVLKTRILKTRVLQNCALIVKTRVIKNVSVFEMCIDLASGL
jgi:hypothetical protein